MPIDWPHFCRIVNAHQRFVVTSHIRPDCDSLGSELGLAGVLDKLGKDVLIANGHATPPNLAFVDPDRRIKVLGNEVSVEEVSAAADVLMILDTSSWAQLGPMSEVVRTTPAVKIVLDHHVKGDDVGAIDFKNTQAEATGRLVAEAAEHLGVPLTPHIASNLFAAIATDTGWFRFSSTTAETYRWASKLIHAGAVPAAIYAELYERDTLGRMKLRGRILERFETDLNGRLAHTFVRASDFADTGALPSDTEDVINSGLAIMGAEVAVILVEQLEGGFKISFRSQCDLDCSEVAAQFGGGGHKAAAGAFVEGDFASAQKKILDAVREAMG
jgi:phosphoesterase RecJ-like protein